MCRLIVAVAVAIINVTSAGILSAQSSNGIPSRPSHGRGEDLPKSRRGSGGTSGLEFPDPDRQLRALGILDPPRRDL